MEKCRLSVSAARRREARPANPRPRPRDLFLLTAAAWGLLWLIMTGSPAFAEDDLGRTMWALPGAEIAEVTGDKPENASVTVKFSPGSAPELFSRYVNGEKKTLDAVRDKTFDVKLQYGKPQTPSKELGITFSLARQGYSICVFATGPNISGKPVWRVRRSVVLEDLANPATFCRAFRGAPASCGEVEGCTETRCLPGEHCGPGACCTPGSMQTSSDDDNCIDLSKLLPEKEPGKSAVKAGVRTMIPAACYDTLVPPSSKLAAAYPNYRSVIGAVGYCIHEIFRNIMHPASYENSFYAKFQKAASSAVTGAMALAVILFGYSMMYGDKKTPGRSEAALLFLKLVAISYFVLGEGTFFVFDAAWKTSSGLAAAAFRASQGVTKKEAKQEAGADGAETKGDQDEAQSDKEEATNKDQLDKMAVTYASLLQEAQRAYVFHQKISGDFNLKLNELEENCSDYSVGANNAHLLSPSGPYSSYLPLDLNANLAPALALSDFYHCGVESVCALESVHNEFGTSYHWKSKDPGLEGLLPEDVRKGALLSSTCEQDVLSKNIDLSAKSTETYKRAMGGDVGIRFKEMKKKVAELFDKYQDYYTAVRMITNHNTLIYFYKTASQKDKELEIVKNNSYLINNQIQTLQKKLAQLDGQIKDIANKFDQSCTKDNPQAKSINIENQRLTKRIEDINTEENDLNKQLEDLKNLKITEEEKAAKENDINAKLEKINNERKDSRKSVNDNLQKLKGLGCIRENNKEKPLDEISGDRTQLQDQIENEKRAKFDNTNEDKRIQLSFKKIALRLEKRLAQTRREFPQYYRELYCALTTVNLNQQGIAATPQTGFKDCPESVVNPQTICLDKHMMIVYDILIDKNDPYYESVMEIRNQCNAVAQKGTAVGEGLEEDRVPAEMERGKILRDFYEVLPLAMNKFYISAKNVCWMGGAAPAVAPLVQTLMKEDLETGEQPGISQNDQAAYAATDSPSPGNPYLSYLNKDQIIYFPDNRLRNSPEGGTATKAKFEPVPFTQDCADGEADLAIQKYCETLFGGNIADEGKGLSFAGEKINGLENFGLHGCGFYLRKTKDTTKLGMLDRMSALDQMCPVRTKENKPVTGRHGWNFSEPMLCSGLGLDGTQRDYYSCKDGTGKAPPARTPQPDLTKKLGKDANIPTSYDDLVRIFGAKDNQASPASACPDEDSGSNSRCYAEDFINCGLQGNDFSKCSTSLPSNKNAEGSKIGEALKNMMQADFTYEMAKAKAQGLLGKGADAAKPNTGAMAAEDQDGSGQELTGKLYPYCTRIAESPDDPMFELWDIMDCKMQRLLGVGAPNISGFSQRSPKLLPLVFAGISPLWPIIAIMGYIVIYHLVFVFFRLAQMFFISFMTSGILLLLSPIFMPMCLFRQTKTPFDKWLNNVIANFIQPITLSVSFIFIFYLIDLAYFGGNHQFAADNSILPACNGKICDQYTLGYAVDDSKFKKLWFLPYVSGIDKGGVKLVVGLAKVMGALFICALFNKELTSLGSNFAGVYSADNGGAAGRAGAAPGDFVKPMTQATKAFSSVSGRAVRGLYLGAKATGAGVRSASSKLKTGRGGVTSGGDKK